MAVRQGKAQTVFRSKSPDLVEQEFRALLSAYNLARGLMGQAGRTNGEDLLDLSFTDSLALIEDYLLLLPQVPTGGLLRWQGRPMRSLSPCPRK